MIDAGSIAPRRAPRPRAVVIAICLLLSLAAAPAAHAQRIANGFDDAAARATQGPQVSSSGGPGGAAPINPMPHVPAAVSRPENWPGAKPTNANAIDNHILSSIRANPGSPLEPLDDDPPVVRAGGTPLEDGTESAADGVVRAGFEDAGTPPPAKPGQPPEIAGAKTLEAAMIVARVGNEVVLEGDLLTPSALAWLAKVSPGLKAEQVRELKLQICKQVLPQHVESMIVYVDACRTIPEERLPEIEKKVNEAFDQQQLPRLVKDAGVANSLEYEQLLRSRGQSLDRIRKTFFERALAQQWVQQKVTSDAEIPHAEMIACYQNHLAEYEFPARARFEQLSIRITSSRPRQKAWNDLAAMGNDVLEGKAFADVAKAGSEGPLASQGGLHDWTTKGSLVSKVLDEALFTLPVGQLSSILDDGKSLHIVRVVERTEAGRTPFLEAQVDIRDRLIAERRKKEMDDYLEKIRERTPVWSIFDETEGPAAVTAGRDRVVR